MIINSILDNDLYKFTMQQAAHHMFPSASAEFKLILRNPEDHQRLLPLLPRIMDEISNLQQLRLFNVERMYLSGFSFFKPDYIEFLNLFRFNMDFVRIQQIEDRLDIRIKGPWVHTTLFEIPILAILSQLYSEDRTSVNVQSETVESFHNMWRIFDPTVTKVADYGTRRRHSYAFHEEQLKAAKGAEAFVGTSNVHFAMMYSLRPIGTMAHEWIMAGQGLGPRIADSQKFMMQKWADEYRGDLGTALTDTINMEAFLNDFDMYFAKLFDGCRHDSGDPMLWANALINHYVNMKIDPMTKTAVFSDNLSMKRIIEISAFLRNRIKTAFGIGTHVTNPFTPLNAVLKLVRINGHPLAKISDEPGKTLCEDDEYLTYVRKVFNVTQLKHIPDYGNHMTMDEWLGNVRCGGFIDYDGHGRYATATMMSDHYVSPSDVENGLLSQDPRWTHVVWFNR